MTSDAEAPPIRDAKHEALAVFLGEWKAEGRSYGGTDQTGEDPKANGVPWVSTHVGRWHTGSFYLVQDEKARPGGQVFDTLSVLGVDVATGEYVGHSFENHGFYRCYRVSREGDTWTFSGEHERATIVFSEDSRKQTITWEWRPKGEWLPLCDRVASRTN
jgi:hypothetical protein